MTCKEGQFDVDDEYGNQGFKTLKIRLEEIEKP